MVTTVQVIDGPNVHESGHHTGNIRLTFDDGRTQDRSISAANITVWNQHLADIPAQADVALKRADAEESPDDKPIAANKTATEKQVAVAYIRSGLSIEEPYEFYKRIKRFDDYRIAQGWTMEQVETQLQSEGLSAADWTKVKTRYQYLSNPARVTTMEAYNLLMEGDPR